MGIGAAIGSTLTKLALRFASLVTDEVKQNRFSAECMLVISAIMHLGSSGLSDKAITRDDSDRLQLCLKVLCDRSLKLLRDKTSSLSWATSTNLPTSDYFEHFKCHCYYVMNLSGWGKMDSSGTSVFRVM